MARRSLCLQRIFKQRATIQLLIYTTVLFYIKMLQLILWHITVRHLLTGGACRHMGLGLSPQNVAYPLPNVKHTGQSGGIVRNFQILIVSVVKICKQCLQTTLPWTPLMDVLQIPWALNPTHSPPGTRGYSSQMKIPGIATAFTTKVIHSQIQSNWSTHY